MYADIALEGLNDRPCGWAVTVPTAAPVLSRGCQWGQSESRFLWRLYLPSPHQAAPPQFHGAAAGEGEEGEPRKEYVMDIGVGNGQRQSMRGKFQGNTGVLRPKTLLHSLHLTESMAETKWWWPGLVWSPCGEMFFSTTHLPWCNSIVSGTTIKLCEVRTVPVTVESCKQGSGSHCHSNM